MKQGERRSHIHTHELTMSDQKNHQSDPDFFYVVAARSKAGFIDLHSKWVNHLMAKKYVNVHKGNPSKIKSQDWKNCSGKGWGRSIDGGGERRGGIFSFNFYKRGKNDHHSVFSRLWPNVLLHRSPLWSHYPSECLRFIRILQIALHEKPARGARLNMTPSGSSQWTMRFDPEWHRHG